MRVSVVVPTYQAGPLLEQQLAALAAQTWTGPLEVLVCDNGSTDGSTDRVASYPYTRLVDASARRGPGPARNIGAAEARGDVLLFCDADDLVSEVWVAAMAEALTEHDVVAGRSDLSRLNSPRVRASRPLPEGLQAAGWGPPYAGAGNLGIRTEVFLALGGFDESLLHLEDVDLSWRLQVAGHALHYEPRATVHVRLRPTWSTQLRQGRNYGRAWAELERRWGPATTSGGAPVVDPVTRHPASRWRTATTLARQALRHPWAGGDQVVWTLGWHVGHHAAEAAGGRRRAGEATCPAAVAEDAVRLLRGDRPVAG